MGKTEDVTRPERVLPTEEGWWWCMDTCHGEEPVPYEVFVGGDGLWTYAPLAQRLASVGPRVTWLCRIPTPEQLSAQSAALAAGQALADAVRRWQAADELWRDLKHGDDLRAAGEASNLMFAAESALRTVDLAAFPAGGAR